MEVPANKVTWPLVYKSLGNNLNQLYTMKSSVPTDHHPVSKGKRTFRKRNQHQCS